MKCQELPDEENDGISSSKLYDSSQGETPKWVVVCRSLMMVYGVHMVVLM